MNIKLDLGIIPCFNTLLTIIFIVLKLCSVISWSWFWVFSPILIILGIICVFIPSIFIVAYIIIFCINGKSRKGNNKF